MNKTLQALLVVLVLALLGERAWETYKWKQYQDERAFFAEKSAQYLFSDTGVKKDGKGLSRAALLDLLLTEVLKRNAAAAGAPAPGEESR